MKDIIDVRLTAGFITLTRKQVEDALAELNKPDAPRPFLPGERVEYMCGNGVLMVLDLPSTNGRLDSLWVAHTQNGRTLEVMKSYIKHLEMAK